MAKRNFLITKKALSSYLNLSRHTMTKKLILSHVDINDMVDILDWLMFEGMGVGRLGDYLRRYLIRKRGAKCEKCGKTENLQFHHKNKRKDAPEWVFIAKNIEILCRDCHSEEEEGDAFLKQGIKRGMFVWKEKIKR